MVIDAAHKEGKWVSLCGEMAGDEVAIPILLGLGLDEFSMNATSILQARSYINQLSLSEMKGISQASYIWNPQRMCRNLSNNHSLSKSTLVIFCR